MNTPKQAMGDILQVSLFKLAETQHEAIRQLRQRNPALNEELNQLSLDIEKSIDDTLTQFQTHGTVVSMEFIEGIHRRMLELKDALN